jgi:hypothetical protein
MHSTEYVCCKSTVGALGQSEDSCFMSWSVERGALIQLGAATEPSTFGRESANLMKEPKVFAHIRSPARIHFAYTDISSLPRSVYSLYFLHHRVARVVSICLSLCVRLHLVLEHQHPLSFEQHLPISTCAPIDPLTGSPPRLTAHPGSPVANRTSATIVRIGVHSRRPAAAPRNRNTVVAA